MSNNDRTLNPRWASAVAVHSVRRHSLGIAAAALISIITVATGCSSTGEQTAAATPDSADAAQGGCANDQAVAAGQTASAGASPWEETDVQEPLTPDARVQMSRPKQSSSGGTWSSAPVLGPNESMLIADSLLDEEETHLMSTTGTIVSLSSCKPRCTYASPSGQSWDAFRGGKAGYVFLSYDASLRLDDPERTWVLNTMNSDCHASETEIHELGDSDKFPRVVVGNSSFAVQRSVQADRPSFTVVPVKGDAFDVPGTVIGVGTALTGSYLVTTFDLKSDFGTITEVSEEGDTLRTFSYSTNRQVLAAAVTESNLVTLEVVLMNTRSYALVNSSLKPGSIASELPLIAAAADDTRWPDSLVGCDNRVGYRVPSAGSGFLDPVSLADTAISNGLSYSNFSPNLGAVVLPDNSGDTVEVYRCGTKGD